MTILTLFDRFGIQGAQPGRVSPTIETLDLSTAEPAGTLEALIANVVPGDVSDPLLPLADLYARSADLPIDRVYVDPDNSLESISVTADATCLVVESVYTEGLGVRQSRGCDDTGLASHQVTYPVRFEDEAWYVAATDGEREDLEVVYLADSEPLVPAGKAFDPNAWLNGKIKADNYVEVARLPYKSGHVSVVTGTDGAGPWIEELLVGVGGDLGSSQIRGFDVWQSCARLAVHKTGVGTFLLVMTADPTWQIETLLDEWTEVELSEADEFGIGLLELEEWIPTPDLRGFHPDGAAVTCLAEH